MKYMEKLKKRFTKNKETVFSMDHCACFCYASLCPCKINNYDNEYSVGSNMDAEAKQWEHNSNFVD